MKKILMILAIAGFASAAQASGAYGDAGCGLGSMLFGSQEGFVQIFAGTTNGISGNQTFGITTGTLNCNSSIIGSTESYIDNNMQALKNDIATGEGQTLAGLSDVLGCTDTTEVSSALSANQDAFYGAINATEMTKEITATLTASNVTCSNI